jgi:AcrR family transcriptional regulator
MDLYVERGFDQTTVADIAERAGLTERTFFRHYADKREVLFAGQELLHELITNALAAVPGSACPIEAMGAALQTVCETIGQNRDFSRNRQTVIDANPALRERELIKLASLADISAESLRSRGIRDPAATLTAEAGIAAFKVGFTTWLASPDDRGLANEVREALDELRSITAG